MVFRSRRERAKGARDARAQPPSSRGRRGLVASTEADAQGGGAPLTPPPPLSPPPPPPRSGARGAGRMGGAWEGEGDGDGPGGVPWEGSEAESDEDEGFAVYEREQLLRAASSGLADAGAAEAGGGPFAVHHAVLRAALREAARCCNALLPLEAELLRLRGLRVGATRARHGDAPREAAIDVEFARERAGIGRRANEALAEATERGMPRDILGVRALIEEYRAHFPRRMQDGGALAARLGAVARELALPLLRLDLVMRWEPLLALDDPRPGYEALSALNAEWPACASPQDLPAFAAAGYLAPDGEGKDLLCLAPCASSCLEGMLRALEENVWLPHIGSRDVHAPSAAAQL